MNPREKMIVFCSKPGTEQRNFKNSILEILEEFLKTATKEDLKILNQSDDYPFEYFGLWLPAEVIMILGAHGSKFFNQIDTETP